MTLKSLADLLPEHPAIRYVPFHSAHVAVMQLPEKTFLPASKGIDLQTMIEAQAKLGQAITVYLHGRPVACFGNVELWPGVAELWSLIEDRARKYALTLTKVGKIYVDYVALSRNAHRLQITVRSGDIRAVRWAGALGFEQECLMKRYGPDQSDFYLFSRT
jgi:hypothetical protein